MGRIVTEQNLALALGVGGSMLCLHKGQGGVEATPKRCAPTRREAPLLGV